VNVLVLHRRDVLKKFNPNYADLIVFINPSHPDCEKRMRKGRQKYIKF